MCVKHAHVSIRCQTCPCVSVSMCRTCSCVKSCVIHVLVSIKCQTMCVKHAHVSIMCRTCPCVSVLMCRTCSRVKSCVDHAYVSIMCQSCPCVNQDKHRKMFVIRKSITLTTTNEQKTNPAIRNAFAHNSDRVTKCGCLNVKLERLGNVRQRLRIYRRSRCALLGWDIQSGNI
jgi:hypothetical protein